VRTERHGQGETRGERERESRGGARGESSGLGDHGQGRDEQEESSKYCCARDVSAVLVGSCGCRPCRPVEGTVQIVPVETTRRGALALLDPG
jgi:hypothetical protein